jgi:dipeptide/tripeptide permease
MVPHGSPVVRFLQFLIAAAKTRSFERVKASEGGPIDDHFVRACFALIRLAPLCALEVPLLIAYDQMTTAFLTQGEKMESSIFGIHMAPALMQNVDPIVVIIASIAIEQYLYPHLRQRDRMPSVLTRFFLGNLLGLLSLLCAYFVEVAVMSSEHDLYSVPIWWQVPQFAFIAVGEIFMISTGYEVAFTYAPDELKAVASATNLMFFAIAGYLSSGLFVVCESWMPDFNEKQPSSYRDSHYDFYFLLLGVICSAGCFACAMFRPYFATMQVYHNVTSDEEVQLSASAIPDVVMPPIEG